MIDLDGVTFERAYRRLCGAFRVKQKEEEFKEQSRSYFIALQGFSLDIVLDAGKVLVQKHKRMPSAADWFEASATLGGRSTQGPGNVRRMSVDELQALWYAERNRYIDDPCSCFLCQQAGVTDKQLRFVPTELNATEFETAYNPNRDAVTVVGHWAHGDELARWYATRSYFFGLTRTRLPKLLRLLAPREVGEEG